MLGLIPLPNIPSPFLPALFIIVLAAACRAVIT